MGGSIYDIIDFIEQTEDWVVSNDPAVSEALDKLSQYFATADSKSAPPHADLIHICAFVYLSQKLRIMQSLDSMQPGLATQLIQSAEKAPKTENSAFVFLQRNLIFERMRILSRILDSGRIQLVKKLYES